VEDRPLNTRVILVRHGESTYNVQKKVQGHCDESSLTDTGREGARCAGSALIGLPFRAVYSSPLQRARETADLILATLEQSTGETLTLRLRDDLKEINLAEWEGLPFAEVEERFPEQYAMWRDRPHDLQMRRSTENAGSELFYPVRALYEQAAAFWQTILPEHVGETILVVAHSGINRALIGTALGLEPHHYPYLYQSNCGISVLNFPAGWGEPAQLESMNLTAHLGQPVPKARLKSSAVRMLLVRHGETDWNRDKRFQGQIDVPLNETGQKQAKDAAEFLKTVPMTRAVTSPLLRPKQTAEAILEHHPNLTLELEPGLLEISHGLWEGKLEPEIEELYAEELKQWKVAPETVQMPEGENLQQVWERSAQAWDSIVRSTQLPDDSFATVLVVAHDAVNKAILCHIMDWGPEYFWRFKQGNGAVSVIDYPNGLDGHPVLQAMNITTGEGVLDKTAAGAL
jgi:probable phosphoglycerate mutase